MDLVCCLLSSEPARNCPLEEQTNHLAVGGADLLPQDDVEAIADPKLAGSVTNGDGPLDIVVVGHGHMGQSTLQRDADELLLAEDGVATEAGVNVKVGECLGAI